jgi:hypothetical protein
VKVDPKETLQTIVPGSNREMLVGILLDIKTAKEFEKWLHDRIEIQENEVKNREELKK